MDRKEATRLRVQEWRQRHPEDAQRQRELNQLRNYKLNPEQIKAMLAAQNNQCLICKVAIVYEMKQPNTLHIDHNHKTEKTRGLLCGHCNRMIGSALENPAALIQGAAYLKEKEAISQ